jgi:hypothetical protein
MVSPVGWIGRGALIVARLDSVTAVVVAGLPLVSRCRDSRRNLPAAHPRE